MSAPLYPFRAAARNASAFQEVIRSLVANRELVFELARREIGDRYAGQALGLFWTVAHPLFLMALYVFVFGFVFRTKIGGTLEMPLDYTTYILAGLVPWMAVQEAMTKSCTAIVGNAGLVKQVVFPLEVLPAKTVVSTLVPQLISTFVLLVYVLATHGRFFASYLLLPALLVLQTFMMVGIAYFLSALTTYFRDTKDFVQLFGIAGMYIIPVVYLPGWVPAVFRPVLYANPFSYLIWCWQDVLYFGRMEHPVAWLVLPAFSLFAFIMGYRMFRKLKPGFGSAL